MRVVLTKKLADAIDGIDLSSRKVGDLLELPSNEASLIVAENWAIADRRASVRAPQTDHNETPGTHPVETASPEPAVVAPATVPSATMDGPAVKTTSATLAASPESSAPAATSPRRT